MSSGSSRRPAERVGAWSPPRRVVTVLLLAAVAVLGLLAAATMTAAAMQPPTEEPVGPPPGPDPEIDVQDNPFEGDPAAIREGRDLFVQFNCAGCHGAHGGGGMGPSLRDQVWIYGATYVDIYDSIAEGRAYGMPAWGTKLQNEQIWRIATYVKVLGTEAEPSPPPPNPSWPTEPFGGTP